MDARHKRIWTILTCMMTLAGCEDRSLDGSGLRTSLMGGEPGQQDEKDVLTFTDPPEMEVRALAEWELGGAVMVCPDQNNTVFYLDLIQVLAPLTRVLVFSPSPEEMELLDRELDQMGVDTDRLWYFEYPCETLWIRDYGPLTVERADGTLAFVDSVYGTKLGHNEVFPSMLASLMGVPVYRSWTELQGGNFMTNGEGLCVTSPLLWEDRISEDAAYVLETFLGCREVIEMQRLPGEETGHVDMYAKFVGPETILLAQLDDDSPDALALEMNAEKLREVALPDGRQLQVVRVPIPTLDSGSYRTSLNSLLVRDAVIVPVYDRNWQTEQAALDAYRLALPEDTRILTVDASGIIDLYGAVHCVTMGVQFTPRAGP